MDIETKKNFHINESSLLMMNAEDGTWTHTSAMLTRSSVLLVCQFRHFRIPYRIRDLCFADHKKYNNIGGIKSQCFFTFYDEIFYKIRYFLIPLKNLLFPYLSEYKSRKSFIKKTFYFYLMRKMGLEPTQAQCLQDP